MKILVVNQFSQLNTGYSNYGESLLKRLSQDFDTIELACEVSQSKVENWNLPWKCYGNVPDDPNERAKFDQNKENDYGRWRFHEICALEKPTHVLSIRDPWMDRFIFTSPYNKYYRIVHLAPVDSRGQTKSWFDYYRDCDAVLTYQDWSGDILAQEAKIDYFGSVPFVSNNAPMSYKERKELRSALGLDGFIIGTVMRNQRRKRFPELFRAFSKVVQKYPQVMLYCHTGHPEQNGFNIPALILENNIQNNVLINYTCQQCGHNYPSVYKGTFTFCKKCKSKTVQFSNSKIGFSNEEMNYMYNTFDMYVQFATCEGLGMPQLEAAAVGCPVLGTEYSAMEDVIPKVKGEFISCVTQKEVESDRWFALPSEEDLINKIEKYIKMSDEEIQQRRAETLKAYQQNYNWNTSYQVWKNAIESTAKISKQDWNSPAELFEPPSFDNKLLQISTVDFVRFCIKDIIKEPKLLGSLLEVQTISDLDKGHRSDHFGLRVLTRQDVYDEFCQIRKYINHCEMVRCSQQP